MICGARTRSGEPCRKHVIHGGNRCATHGGSSPQAKAKAAARLAEQRARRYLADLGGDVEPVTDPIGELERLAGQAVALTDLLRGVVSELEELRYRSSGVGGEQVRGELQAYVASMARSESILGRIIALDLDARRVRVQEAEATAYISAVGRVMNRLGLDVAQQRMARVWLASELGVSPVAALPAGGES